VNTSDPSVHQSGAGTSGDAEHGFSRTGTPVMSGYDYVPEMRDGKHIGVIPVKTNYHHVEGQIATPLETYKSCPDCERLKALVEDVWKFAKKYDWYSVEVCPEKARERHQEKLKKLEARIKQEGIE
jgi:hypothetical protein